MTTYNTGNSVGSVDVRDLYDNAQAFDNFSAGPLDAYPDRFGVSRQSLQGIRNASQYQVLGPYAAGLQFTAMNQVFSYLGEFYAPGPSIVLPYTTTGVGAGEIATFRSVGDAILRQDLANDTDPLKGATIVHGATRAFETVSILRTVTGRYDGDTAELISYYASPRAGGGVVVWDASSVAADDGFLTFAVTGVISGRWVRNISGPAYASMSGAKADYSGGTGTDNRVTLQAAIDKVSHLVVDGHYGITFDNTDNGRGLSIPSNSHLEFSKSGKLSALPHNSTIYQMLRVWGSNNVTITNAFCDGRKDLNAAVTGEFGMGIDVRGGSCHVINNPTTNNCWGDGIYFGITAGNVTAQNVVVNGHKADACRRQGMSITSGINITVNDPFWSNIAGTAPSAGLDIEPDSNLDYLSGIRINRPRTANCTSGILVYLSSLATGGVVSKDVDITICDHIDTGSAISFNGGGCKTLSDTVKVKGRVSNIRPMYINTKNAAVSISEWDALGPCILIDRPVVIDSNQNAQTSPIYGAPFVVLRDAGSVNTYPIGNVVIREPEVILRTTTVPKLFSFADATQPNTNVQNCHFIDPVKLEGVTDQRGLLVSLGSWSDRYGQWGYTIAGTTTLDVNYGAPISFGEASMNITIPSGYGFSGSPDMLLKVTGSNTYNVIGPAAGCFVGTAGTVTQLRSTGAPGSYVRLRPVGSGKYLIIERVGTWADI